MKKPTDGKIPLLIVVGWLITAAWLLLIGWLVSQSISKPGCSVPCDAYLRTLRCMPLNEFGDFLAGTFSFLAFLWLTLAVLLQRSELIAQRIEQTDTKKALREQADQLIKQTEVIIMKHSDEDFLSLLTSLVNKIKAQFLTFSITTDDKSIKVFTKPEITKLTSYSGKEFIEIYAKEITNKFMPKLNTTQRTDLEEYEILSLTHDIDELIDMRASLSVGQMASRVFNDITEIRKIICWSNSFE